MHSYEQTRTSQDVPLHRGSQRHVPVARSQESLPESRRPQIIIRRWTDQHISQKSYLCIRKVESPRQIVVDAIASHLRRDRHRWEARSRQTWLINLTAPDSAAREALTWSCMMKASELIGGAEGWAGGCPRWRDVHRRAPGTQGDVG